MNFLFTSEMVLSDKVIIKGLGKPCDKQRMITSSPKQ